MNIPFNPGNWAKPAPQPFTEHLIKTMHAELTELKRRHQTLLDALDVDRSTSIPKRQVRAILKGR